MPTTKEARLRCSFASAPRCIATAFLLAVLFAASDEWHQTFVSDRDGNARDVLIDAAGAAFAALWLARHSSTRRSQETT